MSTKKSDDRESKLRKALLAFVKVERIFGHHGQHDPKECADCERMILANDALGHGYLGPDGHAE